MDSSLDTPHSKAVNGGNSLWTEPDYIVMTFNTILITEFNTKYT